MKKKDLSLGMLKAENLADIPDQIESQGGARVQLIDHLDNKRAGTLSEVISKLKSKGGSVSKLIGSPVAKKAALVLGGPAAAALGTAQDALASEDVGLDSDIVDPLQNEEALLNIPSENFADPAVAEQARRWQKIRGLMDK